MILMLGARGKVKDVAGFLSTVQGVAARFHVLLQVLDAEVVYGRIHLISAYEHAARAFREGTQATNSLGLETLLYASGECQIQKALAKMGVKPGTKRIAVVLGADEEDVDLEQVTAEFLRLTSFVRDDAVLEGDRETLRRYGIGDTEVATVTPAKYGDLILEKVAMVDVLKR
jgi:KEOPS complex subunit Cgi121